MEFTISMRRHSNMKKMTNISLDSIADCQNSITLALDSLKLTIMKRSLTIVLTVFFLSIPAKYCFAQTDVKWKYLGSYYEGLSCVADANDKYGFIDKTGKVVIPCQWRYAARFHEGLAYIEDFSGNYFHIDKTGKIVK